eukprot:3426746-Pyramimonas_sp.AAC.1
MSRLEASLAGDSWAPLGPPSRASELRGQLLGNASRAISDTVPLVDASWWGVGIAEKPPSDAVAVALSSRSE